MDSSETQQFENLKKQAESINAQLEEENKQHNQSEKRMVKKPGETVNNLEVRGYKKEERLGNQQDVSVGDLIYSYVTGRFKNAEVRQALSTTSGGLALPVEVYKDFLDKLRTQSILGETTIYPMETKSLLIPKVATDPEPHFKLENEPVVESQPLFESVSLEARPIYCMTSISLELIEASNLDVGTAISNIMVNSMTQAMQSAMLTGAVNGYTGILSDPVLMQSLYLPSTMRPSVKDLKLSET